MVVHVGNGHVDLVVCNPSASQIVNDPRKLVNLVQTTKRIWNEREKKNHKLDHAFTLQKKFRRLVIQFHEICHSFFKKTVEEESDVDRVFQSHRCGLILY